MALALLNPYKTQQEIADEFNVNPKTIVRFKKDITDKIPDIGKMSVEELQKQDLDFLEEYKNIIDNEIYLYNIWNLSKGDKTTNKYLILLMILQKIAKSLKFVKIGIWIPMTLITILPNHFDIIFGT